VKPPAAPRPPRRSSGTGTSRGPVDGAAPAPASTVTAPERDPAPAEEAGPARRWLPVRRAPDPAAEQTGFLERLAERARAQRRLAWRKILLLAGLLAVLGAVAWLVLVSPVLALDTGDVTVTGAGEGTTVPRGQVMAVVEERAGTPLARLDTGDLAQDLRAITTVRSVEVTRSWPTGLVVDVVARVPVAAATAEDDDGLVLLDEDGVVVGTAGEQPEDLPRVTVPLSGERAGQTLRAVLTVLAELPPALRAEVATAGATNPASITLELADGAEVLWGGTAESALKAAVLDVLREREAELYDVTVPRAPTLSE